MDYLGEEMHMDTVWGCIMHYDQPVVEDAQRHSTWNREVLTGPFYDW